MAKRFATLSAYLAGTDTRLEDFANRVGVSVAHISMIANGKRTPSLSVATRIASEANIPVASLLAGDGRAA